jgi:predicted TPR repeat methyltransferase
MKRYDRAYFDRWYRNPRSRIATRADVARKARFALTIAEYLLGRPARTVLDIGCGEGAWRLALQKLRPSIEYAGIDSSDYVVERFGARRNIRHGSFAELDASEWRNRFDLIICADVLHYLTAAELRRGLPQVAELLGGVAYLEMFTSADDVLGDRRGLVSRSPTFYRRLLHEAGLTACGLHCYVQGEIAEDLAALEQACSFRKVRDRAP